MSKEPEQSRKLRRECLRLSQRLAEERSRNEELRLLTRAVLASRTWQVARWANDLLGRVLPIGRGPAAWERLETLIEQQGRQYQSLERRLEMSAAGLFSEAATHPAGLYRPIRADAPEERLLVVGSGSLPFELKLPFDCLAEDQLPQSLENYWGVLVLGSDRLSRKTIQQARLAAESHSLPAALWWQGSGHQELESLAAEFDLVASDQTRRGLPDLRLVTDGLHLHRLLSDLHGLAFSSADRIGFTEAAYLRANPDVQLAIEAGDFGSAREHWDLIGAREFRDGSRSCHVRRDLPGLGLRETSPELQRRADEEFAGWPSQPRFSIIVPVYKVELEWLSACVDSVRSQIYPNWQLCLVDDGSDQPPIADYLQSLDDPRIQIALLPENRGIAAASNHGLSMADGDYICLLDHDDELTVDALWLIARVVVRDDPDLVYSDEAKLELDGRVVEPHFKPDFSPAMILSQNYVSHLGAYRRSIVTDIGGFREGFEGSQDHDLLLRFLQQEPSVFHIPKVLYYWRKVPQSTASRFSEKDHAWDSGRRAVQDFLGEAGVAEKGRYPGTYRARRSVSGEPEVAIIIPFRDQAALLSDCLESIIDQTGYSRYQILGVNNQSRQRATRKLMRHWQQHERVRFVDYDDQFNFSAINNFAAGQTDAEQLLMLNNDITVLDSHWLEALLAESQRDEVGAVGGLLLYPDRTIQHAGVILGIGGVAGHSHKYLAESHHGYFCRPHLIQNVSAVTGACLMVKRELFVRLGGLDAENLQVAFNDVDFCLRLREWGYENVYTPYCRLIHHESKSRGAENTREKQARFNSETQYMHRRHGLTISIGDPYYNPNLSLVREDFSALVSAS